MVVMAIWSGLLVIILGFYISATQITRRHDRMSDAYRKVHLLLESLESLLNRSYLYNLTVSDEEPLSVIFSRPMTDQVLSPAGACLYQAPEILVVEPTSEETARRTSRYPIYGQVVLTSKGKRRVLFKLDTANKLDIGPPKGMAGAEHLLQMTLAVPLPTQSKPTSIADLKTPEYQYFKRLILLENSIARVNQTFKTP